MRLFLLSCPLLALAGCCSKSEPAPSTPPPLATTLSVVEKACAADTATKQDLDLCRATAFKMSGFELPGGVYVVPLDKRYGPTVTSWGPRAFAGAPQKSLERYCFETGESFPFMAHDSEREVVWTNMQEKPRDEVGEQNAPKGEACTGVDSTVHFDVQRCGEIGTTNCYPEHEGMTDSSAPTSMLAAGVYTVHSSYVRDPVVQGAPLEGVAKVIVRATASGGDAQHSNRVETWCYTNDFYWPHLVQDSWEGSSVKIRNAMVSFAMESNAPPPPTGTPIEQCKTLGISTIHPVKYNVTRLGF